MSENRWLFIMALISFAGLSYGFFWFGVSPAKSKLALSGSWKKRRGYIILTALNLITLLLMMIFFYFFKWRK
ncbi:MAG: hypothetical protein QOG23_229 [Blastocatellia bacterium]|jgi:hypothetical protein|nr:hypothetical protein [Blastocatellia bacterium]